MTSQNIYFFPKCFQNSIGHDKKQNNTPNQIKLKIRDELVRDEAEVAEEFIRFFASVACGNDPRVPSYQFAEGPEPEWGRTTISYSTDKSLRLPITDIALRDIGKSDQSFWLEIGMACFK
ncbi:Collagen alpha-2(V) chain [Homalodisca vitripennis]|nr:Collagen alpha-2(V) chain [Homalodisca vitripennis]